MAKEYSKNCLAKNVCIIGKDGSGKTKEMINRMLNFVNLNQESFLKIDKEYNVGFIVFNKIDLLNNFLPKLLEILENLNIKYIVGYNNEVYLLELNTKISLFTLDNYKGYECSDLFIDDFDLVKACDIRNIFKELQLLTVIKKPNDDNLSITITTENMEIISDELKRICLFTRFKI